MSTFIHPRLPESNLTRMIHLLPSKNTNAPIECNIFNYDMSGGAGRVQIYEALSYCWESNLRSELIMINNCAFSITKNLHTALLYLRDYHLERTLWVDAICINQDDEEDKNTQIPLMRKIYAQASQVIVWLGDSEGQDGGDKVLEGIQHIAGQIETTQYILELRGISWKLLQRGWFRRIWVLQEVGVARSILVMCGPAQITGYAFCKGLRRLGLSPSLQTQLSPVIWLINTASFRPRQRINSHGAMSLGELMSMYLRHGATVPHDRIYALLGLSSDSTQSAALKPDYRLPWHEVLKNALSYIFPECSIQTWRDIETAVIQGKGWILGHIDGVVQDKSLYSGQHITITFNKVAQSLGYHKVWKSEWTIQTTANLVEEGDVLCLLQGHSVSKPNIVRLCKDHFTIISVAVTPQQSKGEKANHIKKPMVYDITGLYDMLLTWNFPSANTKPELDSEKSQLNLIEKVPGFLEPPREPKLRSLQIVSVILDVAVSTERDLNERSRSKALKKIVNQAEIHGPIIELFKIAIQDSGPFGNALIRLLVQQKDSSLVISEDVFKKAAQDDGNYGSQIMKAIIEIHGQSLWVSKQVLQAAAANDGVLAFEIMALLLDRSEQKQGPLIFEELLRVAVANSGSYADLVVDLLLDRQEQEQGLIISKEVLKVAAANQSSSAPRIMALLLDRQEQEQGLIISEEVLKVAAANQSSSAPRIMALLLDRPGQEQALPISEKLLEIAAANTGDYAFRVMALLLDRPEREQAFPISEKLLEIAAANTGDYAFRVVDLLLDRQEQEQYLLILEEFLKIATARNYHQVKKFLGLLLRQQRKKLWTAIGGTGYRIKKGLLDYEINWGRILQGTILLVLYFTLDGDAREMLDFFFDLWR